MLTFRFWRTWFGLPSHSQVRKTLTGKDDDRGLERKVIENYKLGAMRMNKRLAGKMLKSVPWF